MAIIPPGGYAGFAQMARASQLALSRGGRVGGGGRKRKRRAKRASSGTRKRRKRTSAKRGNRFVKGSAAAKRHMARLRKMRRK